MQPIAIRLLGAAAPKTDEGTIVGNANAAPATAAEPFKNSLRLTVFELVILLLFIGSFLPFCFALSSIKLFNSQAAKCKLVTVPAKADIAFLIFHARMLGQDCVGDLQLGDIRIDDRCAVELYS